MSELRLAAKALICCRVVGTVFIALAAFTQTVWSQTSSPSSSASVTVADDPQVLVDNRLGSVIPNLQQIPLDPRRPTTVMLADEIDLGNCSVDSLLTPAPHHLIVVADTVQIKGDCSLQLGIFPSWALSQPGVARPTSALTFVARNLIIKRQGMLCAMACRPPVPWNPNGPPPFLQVPVVVTIAAEKVDGSEKADYWLGLLQDPDFKKIFESEPENYPGFIQEGILGPPSAPWKAPYLQEVQSRPASKPIDDADYEFMRRVIPAWFRNDLRSASVISLFARLVKSVGPDGKPRNFFAVSAPSNVFDKLSDSAGSDPQAGFALSLWSVETISNLQTGLYDAQRREDRSGLLALLKRYESLPSYPIIPAHRAAYQQLLGSINQLRASLGKHLWQRSVSIDLPGLPTRDVDVFTEGTALEGRLPPTFAVVTQRVVDGRSVLGTLQYKSEGSTQELVLNFDAELTVDPLMADAVSKKLATLGEKYAGAFTNWTLTARPVIAEGVKSSSITQSGNVLNVTLHLDPTTGPLALWRLTSDVGLPLTFDYQYNNDLQQKGTLNGTSLSLARREKPAIIVGGSGVKNTGQVPLTIAYFQTPTGELRPLVPAVTIGPNETQLLPQLNGVDAGAVNVPPQAVSAQGQDPFSLNDFYNIGDVQLIDTITVKNALPPVDTSRNARLLYVELTLSYTSGEGPNAKPQVFGPFHLLSPPAEGSEKKIPFFRLQQGARHVQISGKAVYENGGQDFTATSSDQNIEIRPDLVH